MAGMTSPFLTGNISSIRVHFPASYVRLPECKSLFCVSPSGCETFPLQIDRVSARTSSGNEARVSPRGLRAMAKSNLRRDVLVKKMWLLMPVFSSWWFQPIWKNARQIGSFPQVGVTIQIICNHHLVFVDPQLKKAKGAGKSTILVVDLSRKKC